MQDTRDPFSLIVMLGYDAGNDEEVEKAEAPQMLSAAAFGEREIEEEPLKNMKVRCAFVGAFYHSARDACRERDAFL